MTDIRTPLKAIQWERAKGELRAFAALAGSYSSSEGMGDKWKRIDTEVKWFIDHFEKHGLHE